MKLGKNQILLPSGVATSKDGKYHYWQCSVSGLVTFAKPDYWVKIMAKYGSEKNLVKTYVCKKAQALLNEGLTKAEVREKMSKPETVADKKARKATKEEKVRRKGLIKKPRKKGLKSFAVGKDEVLIQNETGSLIKEVVPVYPWQDDPNYFRGGPPVQMSIEEATKDSCAYPRRYLDDDCQGCPIYDRCKCRLKVDASVWSKPRKKNEVVIKPIKAFDEVPA